MVDGLRLAFGTLSVLPAGTPGNVDRRVAGRAMALAPLVGLVLGGIAGLVVYGAHRVKPDAPLLAAVLGVIVLMALSGVLHLDGLADSADGFGSRRDRETKLRIMKQSDIGPFGVVSIAAVLLIDVAALQACVQNGFGWQALLIAGVASRLTLPWSCRTSVPSARPDGLGAMVAGTVRPYAALLLTLVATAGAATVGWLASRSTALGWWSYSDEGSIPVGGLFSGGSSQDRAHETLSIVTGQSYPPTSRPYDSTFNYSPGNTQLAHWLGLSTLDLTILGAAIAVLAAVLLSFAATRRTRKSLGGITGDTLGATVELALPTTLLVLAFTT
ncbi:adenosylcobinamide-GDP ribazoletransferase [Kribbella sp. NBC_00382]|uniref:adenosylcobinamide-GDP ribazoletransferase n=1 Tax=Kribbella sp. NBC_00382 TaxID=2975967 RepID=UPI002E217CEF